MISKDKKQDGPAYVPLGTTTTCDQAPAGFNSFYHHTLGPALQLVLHTAECICPGHELQASPGEHCGRQCQRLCAVWADYMNSPALITRLVTQSQEETDSVPPTLQTEVACVSCCPAWPLLTMGHYCGHLILKLTDYKKEKLRREVTICKLLLQFYSFASLVLKSISFHTICKFSKLLTGTYILQVVHESEFSVLETTRVPYLRV